MKKNGILAGAFGIVAAIIYFITMADYAFPGESAHLMACWKGLVTEPTPQYPLMAAFAKALGASNVLAPISGILAVMALFHLVAAFLSWRVKNELDAVQRVRIPLVAALAAATVFVVTPAVRSAATHLEPKLFDFAWAAISFALAIPFFGAVKNLAWLYAMVFGALMALGFCDSAIFLALLPFAFALIARMSLVRGKKPYLAFFLFVLFFVLTFFVALGSFGVDFAEFMKRTNSEVRLFFSLPGWIFIALFATLPFVTAIFSSGSSFRDKTGLVTWLFHSALSFVAILAVATPLSPSSLLKPFGIAPVMTSAFAAALAGYLVAFWWHNRRQVVAMVAGGIFGFILTVTVVWNLFCGMGSDGSFADKVARKILDDLGDRRWLVTDGVLDDHLKLVADEMGREVNIVSLAKDSDEIYLAELADLVRRENVGGSKNASLCMSLSLGVLPFVQDWLAGDPTAAKELAIFGAPDLWYGSGVTPVPEFFFFGGDPARTPDWSVWKEFDVILKAPKGWGSYHDRKIDNPVDRLRFSLRRHLGFVANNRGVYLQDQQKDDEAFAMYELVLNEIDHDNICAIFNEVGMIGQKHPKAMTKKRDLERMLKAAVEDKNRRYLLWRLGTYYGYIRNPDSFIRLGHAWARSGRPGDALSQIRRAIDFVPTDKRSVLLNMMASLYASENDQKKSRKIYESVLKTNARDHDALVGLMRLSLMEGNGKKAMEYLEKAVEVASEGDEKGDKRLTMERAMLAMMKGELKEAKSLVRKMTDADAKDMQAWSLLAAATMQQIDMAKDEKVKQALLKELEGTIVPAMEKQAADQFDYYLQTTKGFLLLRKGATSENRVAARDAFVAATRSRPDVVATQDLVLGLDISLDDKENAATHAKDVLRRNRNAPLANYVLGSLALGQGKYAEAEAYLRKAADAPQPVTLALNDLAEVLRRNRSFAEAEQYARKAADSAPGLYVAWETLGSVLMELGPEKLDEAEACIRKACQLSKDGNGNEADVRMLVSLARVQIKRNDILHAKVTIRKVRARLSELSDYEKAEFETIAKGVK